MFFLFTPQILDMHRSFTDICEPAALMWFDFSNLEKLPRCSEYLEANQYLICLWGGEVCLSVVMLIVPDLNHIYGSL